MVKNKRQRNKRHICLFMYASIQGIYLALTHGMGVEEFSMAFRGFDSHKGLFATISYELMIMQNFRSIPWTDGKDLPTCINFMLPYRQSDQLDFHISKGSLVEWILGETIQSLKRCFRKLIGQYTLMFEQLQTLI